MAGDDLDRIGAVGIASGAILARRVSRQMRGSADAYLILVILVWLTVFPRAQTDPRPSGWRQLQLTPLFRLRVQGLQRGVP